jgi:hypothetical protein
MSATAARSVQPGPPQPLSRNATGLVPEVSITGMIAYSAGIALPTSLALARAADRRLDQQAEGGRHRSPISNTKASHRA